MRNQGQRGEDSAALWLEKKDYKILERNFRFPGGEVDIIAVRDGCLTFIEVKNWKVFPMQELEYSVGFRKLEKIRTGALWYLQNHDAILWDEMEFILMYRQEGISRDWVMIRKVMSQG